MVDVLECGVDGLDYVGVVDGFELAGYAVDVGHGCV